LNQPTASAFVLTRGAFVRPVAAPVNAKADMVSLHPVHGRTWRAAEIRRAGE
jgi:hypothetical protein